jgi:TatD DNase family protein
MIDTHFHSLVMKQKGLDPGELLASAFGAGLRAAIDIGTRADDLAERLALVRDFPEVFMAAGVYPSYSVEGDLPALVERLEGEILGCGRPLVGIGECGIDLHWDYAPAARQQELLHLQIELANRLGLPVIIHNREADGEVLEVLRLRPPEAGGVLHCYSSGGDVLSGFLDAGMYVSFAGNLTYKNARDIQEAARRVPLERVLFETDSPYLAPVPLRGKPNHPALVVHTYRLFAELRGIDPEDLVIQVRSNAAALFPALGGG